MNMAGYKYNSSDNSILNGCNSFREQNCYTEIEKKKFFFFFFFYMHFNRLNQMFTQI